MRCNKPICVSIPFGGDVLRVHKTSGVNYPYQSRASFMVPCGKCVACKNRRKQEMVFRMDMERRFGHLLKDGSVKKYRYCFFITLSYAPEFLPRFTPLSYDKRTGEVFDFVEVGDDHPGILNPENMTAFMKRLRRYYNLDCKVFYCGEYGSDYDRPHYHLIFFSDFDWQSTVNACRRAWSVSCPKDRIGQKGTFQTKDGKYLKWRLSFGRVDVKQVNMRRMRYCAKYVCKDTDSKKEVPKFGRVSHFLGTGWLLSSEARATRSNKRLFAYLVDGSKCSIGRYFTHRIFSKEELKSCVDSYVFENECPPEGCEFGDAYRAWFDDHVLRNRGLVRSLLAKTVIPKLSYV